MNLQWISSTSYEQHLGLLADGLDLIILGIVIHHVDCLLHVAQHKVAVAVVCLYKVISVRAIRQRGVPGPHVHEVSLSARGHP